MLLIALGELYVMPLLINIGFIPQIQLILIPILRMPLITKDITTDKKAEIMILVISPAEASKRTTSDMNTQ